MTQIGETDVLRVWSMTRTFSPTAPSKFCDVAAKEPRRRVELMQGR